MKKHPRMEIRTELIKTIFEQFKTDLGESASLIPDTKSTIFYVEKIREFLLGIYYTRPTSDIGEAIYFDEDEFIRQHLYANLHEKMDAFDKTGLRYYFCKESHHQEQLFKKLNIKEPLLNWKEYEDLSNRQLYLLNKSLDKLYKKPTEETAEAGEKDDTAANRPGAKKRKEMPYAKEYTRNRQAMIFHYFMGSMDNVIAKKNRADLARFAHALFAEPFDDLENSFIYKNIKNAPLHLSGTKKQKLKDLQFVRERFALIDCQPAIKLIDADIAYVERNEKD